MLKSLIFALISILIIFIFFLGYEIISKRVSMKTWPGNECQLGQLRKNKENSKLIYGSAVKENALTSDKKETSNKFVKLNWVEVKTIPHRLLASEQGLGKFNYRTEFEEIGQYQLLDAKKFLDENNFRVRKLGDFYQFHGEGFHIGWQEGKEFFNDSRVTLQSFVLPVRPIVRDGIIYYPARTLAESLGLLTKYESGKVYFSFPPSNFSTAKMKLIETIKLNNSEVSLSYFHTAFETPNEIYLTVDHAHEIYRFSKPAYDFDKIEIPERYGFISSFLVDEFEKKMYISTSGGDFLKYDLTGKKLEEIISEGITRPRAIGQTFPADEINVLEIPFFTFSIGTPKNIPMEIAEIRLGIL